MGYNSGFREKCGKCNTHTASIYNPKMNETRRIHPYLDGFPRFLCKNCVLNAQIRYLNKVPLEDLPLIINIRWLIPEGMQALIRERYEENEH